MVRSIKTYQNLAEINTASKPLGSPSSHKRRSVSHPDRVLIYAWLEGLSAGLVTT